MRLPAGSQQWALGQAPVPAHGPGGLRRRCRNRYRLLGGGQGSQRTDNLMARLEDPTTHRELSRMASGDEVDLPFGRLRVISSYRLGNGALCREFRLTCLRSGRSRRLPPEWMERDLRIGRRRCRRCRICRAGVRIRWRPICRRSVQARRSWTKRRPKHWPKRPARVRERRAFRSPYNFENFSKVEGINRPIVPFSIQLGE